MRVSNILVNIVTTKRHLKAVFIDMFNQFMRIENIHVINVAIKQQAKAVSSGIKILLIRELDTYVTNAIIVLLSEVL